MKLAAAMAIGGTVWIICAAYSYAVDFAYFQRAYPEQAAEDYRFDRIMSLALAVFGPISLVGALVFCRYLSLRPGWYGFKWR